MAGGGVDMDVKISKNYDVGGSRTEGGKKIVHLWDETWIWFRWPVD